MITRPNDKKCTFLHHNKVNKNMSKITQETKHYILDLVREHESKLTQNKKKKTRRIVGRRNAGGTKRKVMK